VQLEELAYICKPQDLAELYNKQHGLCMYCNVKLTPGGSIRRTVHDALVVDHYNSLSGGGDHELPNLVLSCTACNQLKGTMHGGEFKVFLVEFARRVLQAVDSKDKEPLR
jgi:5-methylcytosine-specific restriction endonuclease McrA